MKMSTRITALVFSILILTSMVIVPVSAGLSGDAECPLCGGNNLGDSFWHSYIEYKDEQYHTFYDKQFVYCPNCGGYVIYFVYSEDQPHNGTPETCGCK